MKGSVDNGDTGDKVEDYSRNSFVFSAGFRTATASKTVDPRGINRASQAVERRSRAPSYANTHTQHGPILLISSCVKMIHADRSVGETKPTLFQRCFDAALAVPFGRILENRALPAAATLNECCARESPLIGVIRSSIDRGCSDPV